MGQGIGDKVTPNTNCGTPSISCPASALCLLGQTGVRTGIVESLRTHLADMFKGIARRGVYVGEW